MAISLEFVPRLMRAPQAAHYLGVSVSKLRELPIPSRSIGRITVWDKLDLDAYADALHEEEGEACDKVFAADRW